MSPRKPLKAINRVDAVEQIRNFLIAGDPKLREHLNLPEFLKGLQKSNLDDEMPRFIEDLKSDFSEEELAGELEIDDEKEEEKAENSEEKKSENQEEKVEFLSEDEAREFLLNTEYKGKIYTGDIEKEEEMKKKKKEEKKEEKEEEEKKKGRGGKKEERKSAASSSSAGPSSLSSPSNAPKPAKIPKLA